MYNYYVIFRLHPSEVDVIGRKREEDWYKQDEVFEIYITMEFASGNRGDMMDMCINTYNNCQTKFCFSGPLYGIYSLSLFAACQRELNITLECFLFSSARDCPGLELKSLWGFCATE